MNVPTVRSANLLMLISAVLIFTAGWLMQFYSPAWGLLATELLLILAPLLLLLYRRRLPVAATLALRWTGARPVALAALMGLGTYALGGILAGVGYWLLGYAPQTGVASAGVGAAVVMFLAIVIAAPLCEEAFFRGYLFQAYLGRGTGWAIVATALFFAFFHMRFAALLGFLPAAFALSFVRWRSNSLLPGIALHMVQNLMGAGLGQLQAMTGRTVAAAPDIRALGIYVVIGLVALVLFALTERQTLTVTAHQPQPRFWLRAWPAVLFVAIFAAFSTGEVLLNKGLLPLASRPLQYAVPASWNESRHWRYEVRDAAERKIGELDCLLDPSVATISLTCTGTGSPFSVTWRRSDMALLTMSLRDDVADLPNGALATGEWPWRFMARPSLQFAGARVTLASPDRVASEPINVLTRSGRMRVLGREYTTTVVQVGRNEVASYATEGDPLLLRYSTGTVSYVITAAD